MDSLGDFPCQIDGRNLITLGHRLMISNDGWSFALVDLFDLTGVDELEQDDIDLGIGKSGSPDDPFHSTNLFDIRKSIRVIIHGGFFKQ